MRGVTTLVALVLLCSQGLADTHYVSTVGSSVPPYTSWETAADSIQKGIDIASYGDTVRVGPGTYRETLIMSPGIALLGAGMHCCMIDASLSPDSIGTIIWGADSSSIEGFDIKGRGVNSAGGMGIYSSIRNALKRIKNNRISDCRVGTMSAPGSEVSNNIIRNAAGGLLFLGAGVVMNNSFIDNEAAIVLSDFYKGGRIIKNLILHTTVYEGIGGGVVDSIFIENNFIAETAQEAILVWHYGSGGTRTIPIRNNTLIGKHDQAVLCICQMSNEVTNNIICGGLYGIHAFQYDGWTTQPRVSYNALWNNQQNYYTEGGAQVDTSLGGNIYLNPMFVGGEDYHLQYASPCIDAGNPGIKDPDSSGSDMGCYGGAYGETYAYQDYPPQAPDSLRATSLNTVIVVSWKPNSESDLSHYLVYKDTLAGFMPDTFKIVGNVPKDTSLFRDYDFILGKTYYYQASAWDLTGHESEYSDELAVLATAVGEYQEEENRPPEYRLFQNYPNPFNSSTVIWYSLPDVGCQPAEVEIGIYNLLGQLVRTLIRQRQYPGQHRVEWDGKGHRGNEVGSGLYFCRLSISGFELTRPVKMLLLK